MSLSRSTLQRPEPGFPHQLVSAYQGRVGNRAALGDCGLGRAGIGPVEEVEIQARALSAIGGFPCPLRLLVLAFPEPLADGVETVTWPEASVDDSCRLLSNPQSVSCEASRLH